MQPPQTLAAENKQRGRRVSRSPLSAPAQAGYGPSYLRLPSPAGSAFPRPNPGQSPKLRVIRYDHATHDPAQRHFVHRFIDWDRVGCRLESYPAIGRTFPLKILKKYGERPPYYCHYMAWRLGTWWNESLFQRLEELLCCAEALDHWDHEKKSLVNSPEFGEFWSLVWQLQVAEHLCAIGTEVRWGELWTRLSVTVGGNRWYVECYSYHKSFGLFLFLQEENCY